MRQRRDDDGKDGPELFQLREEPSPRLRGLDLPDRDEKVMTGPNQ